MCYMIEGGETKVCSKSKKWLYSSPEIAHTLLKLLTDVIVDYLVMQVEYGAQILQIFDSNAGILNKQMYMKFCVPYLKQIKKGVHDKVQQKKLEQVPMVMLA